MEVHILWEVWEFTQLMYSVVIVCYHPNNYLGSFSLASSQPLAIKMWPLCLKYLHSWRASCRPAHYTVLTLGQLGSAFPPPLVDTLAAYLEDCNLLLLIASNITSSYHVSSLYRLRETRGKNQWTSEPLRKKWDAIVFVGSKTVAWSSCGVF